MVSNRTRQAYSEVNCFINLLDEELKNKVPLKLREFFEREKDDNYIKEIVPDISIEDQNLKRETLAIIAYLNLKYWCEDEQEKQRLIEVYKENEKKYTDDIYERINSLNSSKSAEIKVENSNSDKGELVKVEKETIFSKLVTKIRKLFNMKE